MTSAETNVGRNAEPGSEIDPTYRKSFGSLRVDKSGWDSNWQNDPEQYRGSRMSKFMEVMGIKRSMILEVGCGDRLIDPKGTLKGNYVGGDLSLNSVRTASKTHDASNFLNLEATRLPFRDGSFLTVVSIMTMHHYGPDALAAIGEMMRVSSRFVMFTVEHEENIQKLLDMPRKTDSAYERVRVGGFEAVAQRDTKSGKLDMDGIRLFFNVENMERHMKQVGFKKVRGLLRYDINDGEGTSFFPKNPDDKPSIIEVLAEK
ncbi:MAG TPA: class I SAM-dependent methyltransferase [Candidatus Acidoferrales bacterium]|nr:class I SAM-dependent methyltransferase [Candidatus Acidoferrales bacterium]